MTKAETLEKAIKKAIAGGYYYGNGTKDFKITEVNYPSALIKWPSHEGQIVIPLIIFNHDFAKALFGEEQIKLPDMQGTAWKLHLMLMVIANDPLEYLGENLPKD